VKDQVSRPYKTTGKIMRDFRVSRGWREEFMVFWVVAPCSVVAGYQRLGGPCCPG